MGLDKVHEFQTQVSRSQAGFAKARFEYVFHMAHCIRCSRRLVAPDAIPIIEERLKNDSANMRTSYKLHKSVIGDLQLRLAKQPRFHDLSEEKRPRRRCNSAGLSRASPSGLMDDATKLSRKAKGPPHGEPLLDGADNQMCSHPGPDLVLGLDAPHD